jgi:SH3-like domain-containing protein
MRRASRRFGALLCILTVCGAATALAQTGAAPVPLAKPPAQARPQADQPARSESLLPDAAPPAPLLKPRGRDGAVAEAPPGAKTGSVTGLPVPRFVSLAADKVNARVGPGTNYPISWVYTRRNLPVEVIAEYELFRKIRDQEGTESWVHKNLLSGRRYVLITGGTRMLRERPEDGAPVALMAEGGVQGRLLKCKGTWCQLEVQGNKGYAPRSYLWGVYADETIE